jgi:hypothetical protein
MGVVLLLLMALQAGSSKPNADLSVLTVPPEILGQSCELSPRHSEPLGGNRFRSGFWGPVPLPRNPWYGDDLETTARIGEIVVGPEGVPRLPDGPPLDRGEIADLRRQLFEGASGYAAAYRNGENLTFVYAIQSGRLDVGMRSGLVAQRPTDRTNDEVFRARGLWVRIVGSRGPCFDAARRHLEHALAALLQPKSR